MAEASRTVGINETSEGGHFMEDLGFIMDGQTGWEHSFSEVPMYSDGAKFLGKAGRITYRLEKADSVDGHELNVRATPSRRGEDAGSRPVDSGKGAKSKDLAALRGTEYKAYIDGDQTVAIHK